MPKYRITYKIESLTDNHMPISSLHHDGMTTNIDTAKLELVSAIQDLLFLALNTEQTEIIPSCEEDIIQPIP